MPDKPKKIDIHSGEALSDDEKRYQQEINASIIREIVSQKVGFPVTDFFWGWVYGVDGLKSNSISFVINSATFTVGI